MIPFGWEAVLLDFSTMALLPGLYQTLADATVGGSDCSLVIFMSLFVTLFNMTACLEKGPKKTP